MAYRRAFLSLVSEMWAFCAAITQVLLRPGRYGVYIYDCADGVGLNSYAALVGIVCNQRHPGFLATAPSGRRYLHFFSLPITLFIRNRTPDKTMEAFVVHDTYSDTMV